MTMIPTIDLAAPASFADGQPHDQYRWLRRHDPVHFHPAPAAGTPGAAGSGAAGFWAVMSHAGLQAVSRDPRRYSSWLGGVMLQDAEPEHLEASRKMMLQMDAPDHTRFRRLVSPGFTPKAVGAWRERIDALAVAIIDAVIDRGECDLVADVAGEMPSLVVAELMGIGADDGRRLYQLTEVMHSADPALTQDDHIGAMIEMLAFGAGVAAAKRARPADDLATVLVHAELDGVRLTDEEFTWFFLLLVNAGGDTTRNLVAGGVEVLLERPSEWARLVADPDALMPTAVEELLRFVSPVVHMRRTATVDTELDGRPIAAGDRVVVFYASANRDESVWADPDVLDLRRPPGRHVAFGGGGPHLCLGAHIARLEIGALMGELARRMPDLRADGPIERLASTFVAGPRHFPVRYTPRRRLGG